jgi:pyridoxal phosphate enzyme (YggS family)
MMPEIGTEPFMNPNDMFSNYSGVLHRVREAAVSAGRAPSDIRIVAVSKKVPTERVKSAITQGITLLGENYIQEAREKVTTLSHLPASWHFIGHLQSNKAKYAVRLFDLIHSVDSLKLAAEIDRQANRIDKIQDILIQVNIAEEKSKSGVSITETPELVRNISTLSNVRVRGLMAMPPFFGEPEKARPFFKALCDLSGDLARLNIANVEMRELSMGMSGDFETAISEGATLVRVGTAIFGSRS